MRKKIRKLRTMMRFDVRSLRVLIALADIATSIFMQIIKNLFLFYSFCIAIYLDVLRLQRPFGFTLNHMK